MPADLVQIYDAVMERARADGFAGWDPFDGLESRIFQATPFRYLAPARVAWLQMVKRSPVNLRNLLLVPKGVNDKGLALFALAELARCRTKEDPNKRGHMEGLIERLHRQRIERTVSVGVVTASYGYNFDWQSRAFFAPKGTPTIVPTAFAVRAFAEARKMFGRTMYDETLSKIGAFVTQELNRPHETNSEVCFSYTSGDQSLIYNASLLAAETLVAVGAKVQNDEYLDLAAKAARYAITMQGERGEWTYGPKLRHAWIDNFHTAFMLSSLLRIGDQIPAIREDANNAIAKGFEFWIVNFFTDDGAPKYFDTQTYPIDIHAAAASIVTLCDLRDRDERALPMAERVAEWTVNEMWNADGFFSYQKRRSFTVRIPYIRWGQAWMAYAIARLLEVRER